jgi:hypothetical protein
MVRSLQRSSRPLLIFPKGSKRQIGLSPTGKTTAKADFSALAGNFQAS